MKKITKEYTVYTFDELDELGKDEAHARWLENGDCWAWSGEARDTIDAVEKLFDVRLSDWSIGSYRPEMPTIDFGSSWTDERRELCGNRARAFLFNHFGHVLNEPVKTNGRPSKVFSVRVYDGTCPLTGVCFDCDALDPMAYFCFGVEWNEKEQRRTMTKCRTIRNDNQTTVESVIEDCVYSLFRALNADCEYSEGLENFAEECKANDWTFTADGRMMNA